ncbi:sigma factor-like helix-turn-helix DNA-binding protein [Vibrio rotiferianus]
MKKKISFSPEECMADALLYRSKEEWEEESPLIYGYAKKTNQIRKCVKAIKEHAITVRRSIAMRQALAVNALVKGSYYQASKPSLAKHQEEISLDPDSHLHNAIRFFIASQEEIPRVILSKRFGIGSKTFTNQAIGDELGVSRQRVNQIEKKLLALLQEKLSAEMPGLMVAMRSLKHKHELVSQLPATLNLFSKESKGVQFIEKLLGE